MVMLKFFLSHFDRSSSHVTIVERIRCISGLWTFSSPGKNHNKKKNVLIANIYCDALFI